jgi:hypothetical protein
MTSVTDIDDPRQDVDADRTLKEVPIEWEALEDAFENNAPEVHSYLHLGTGEVLRVVDGVADPEMHARIASEANYLRVEPVSSREQYRWMERYIAMVEDHDLRAALGHAIDGKGAFRRFKDALMAHAEEREAWFTFRSERLRVFMEAWLTAHALKAVPRQVWEGDAPAEGAAAPVARAAAPNPRSSEAVRKQLVELAETLGCRDLEKVLAFAEFVKARRATRSHASKSSPPPAPATEEQASEADLNDEEPTPSSRRRAASATR